MTDVDVFAGGLSELPEEGSVLGPLFNCLIGKQFRDLKFGDRYWYENPGVGGFTPGKQQPCVLNTQSGVDTDNNDILHKTQVTGKYEILNKISRYKRDLKCVTVTILSI